MSSPSRRAVVSGIAASGLLARTVRAAESAFDASVVAQRARALAQVPFASDEPALLGALAGLDYDAWRDIRFKPDRAFLGEAGGAFRLQLFHRGFLYQQRVAVNLVRGGAIQPIAYDPDLFDFGRTRLSERPSADFGFAGIRVHYPLNRPDRLDELAVFVGASYFRFLGRDQLYGLSARAVALGTDSDREEFPSFREFWIEVPEGEADALVVHALLDGAALTGAYRFTVQPGRETVVSVEATLFPRRALPDLGLAPLTSMFFIGESTRGHSDDYRPELHDSDGLQLAAGSGEWLWRPLDNPASRRIVSFADRDPKGFGLMQRDRAFENYQDLEAGYERRPSCFAQMQGAWGEGRVVLVELPTDNETADNIVAFWRPAQAPPAAEPFRVAYRLRSMLGSALHSNAHALNTFAARSEASGAANRPRGAGPEERRRFLIDFTGGDLPYFLTDPAALEVVASATQGRIVATSLTPNPHIGGFRAVLDLQMEKPGTSELRVFLRAHGRTLSETWSYPWTRA